MKARQLHLPHMCLANCCSGRRASLSGVWELIEARIGIPALCWVEQGVSMLLKAVLVQVVVELKLEYIYIPIPLGLCGSFDMAPCPWSGFAETRLAVDRRTDLI